MGLRHYFDVAVINANSDFSEACDLHEPDIALFESGYRSHGSRRISVRNTASNPALPRIALHNGDAWCDRRSGLLADLEDWRIEAVFTICTLTPAYTPSVATSLYVWPNFINPAVHRDYGLAKTTDIFLTGQTGSLYPWRRAVFPKLKARYDCTYSPAAPYGISELQGQLSGDRYARQINASHIVPTCGTIAGEVVRKHFEVPGSRACLLTEKTSGLEAAGFQDMVNCVFADPNDVVDKIDALLADRNLLAAVTEAGHTLIGQCHTFASRPQILQWYEANRARCNGQPIVQDGPFGDLRIGDTPSALSRHLNGSGLDRQLLRQGDRLMEEKRFDLAEAKYIDCLEYIPYLPEAKLRLAVAQLNDGRPGQAKQTIIDLIRVSLIDYGASRPDPIEWAVYLIALICCDEGDKARRLAAHYPSLRTNYLDLIFRILGLPLQPAAQPSVTRTIHDLPGDVLKTSIDAAHSVYAARADGPMTLARREGLTLLLTSRVFEAAALSNRKPNVPPTADFSYAMVAVRNLIGRGRFRTAILCCREIIRASLGIFQKKMARGTVNTKYLESRRDA